MQKLPKLNKKLVNAQKPKHFYLTYYLYLGMPLTGLVAEARRRTALINKNRQQIKQEVKRVIDFSAELEQAAQQKHFHWEECRHLKQAGGRCFCKRYMSLCAQERCNSKYVNAEETEIDLKRVLRGK